MHPETTKPLPSRVPSSLPPVRTLSFWLVLLPLLGLLTMLLPAGAPTEASPAAITERISVDSQGGQADAGSGPPLSSAATAATWPSNPAPRTLSWATRTGSWTSSAAT